MISPKKRIAYGIYFIFIGILFLANIAYVRFDQNSKRFVYEYVNQRFQQGVRNKTASPYYREIDQAIFERATRDLEKLLDDFRASHIDKIHIRVIVVAISGVITALLYLCAGVRIIKNYGVRGTFLTLAAVSFGFYGIFFLMSAYKEISFMDVASVHLLDLAREARPHMERLKGPDFIRNYFGFIQGRLSLFLALGTGGYVIPVLCFFQSMRKTEKRFDGIQT